MLTDTRIALRMKRLQITFKIARKSGHMARFKWIIGSLWAYSKILLNTRKNVNKVEAYGQLIFHSLARLPPCVLHSGF